jgi:hypothetical protein
MKEPRAESSFVIPDVDSQVLGKMLEWMYNTGKASVFDDPGIAHGLLAVADKYQMAEFKVSIFFVFPSNNIL